MMTSDELFEPMMPAPREPPPAARVNHAELGQAWRCEVYRNPAGRPLLVLVSFACGRVLPLLFARGGGWDEDGRHGGRGWRRSGPGVWRDGGGWEVLSAPAETAAPDRPSQPDPEAALKSYAWQELLGETEPLDGTAVRP